MRTQFPEPYMQRVYQWLGEYEPYLWENLHRVPQLSARDEILAGFLELACQCQASANILIGRYAINTLPREWILQAIESCAEKTLDLTGE